MTTQLDTDLLATAKALIVDEFGTSATWTSRGATADPTTGTVAAGTARAVTIASPQPVRRDLVDSVNVLETDMETFLAASGLTWTPEVGDTVTVGTDDYRVVSLRPLRARDDVVAWHVRMRT